ncbi:hypothetical protein QYE76_021440 [Lolium multiflorum]|uniref:Uncharacterized protein n=1 Tax=Lolium multiflorum TaxID=4521 RepID=A0AAD8R6J5_LOLMU|nr:hypothetical protein QYE76_021440 [Lolium multiflorum]
MYARGRSTASPASGSKRSRSPDTVEEAWRRQCKRSAAGVAMRRAGALYVPDSLREFAAGGRWYREDPPLKPMSGVAFEKWRAEWERERAAKAAWAARIGSTSGGGSGGDPRAGEEEVEEDAAFYGAKQHQVLPVGEWWESDFRAGPGCPVGLSGRPHPEFHGVEVNDQPGGELQWIITADLRGKMEPPTSERILFTFRESNWLDGLARALQEALARLCGQNVEALQEERFAHLARRNTAGEPMDLPLHPQLRHHVDHLDFMLYHTQQDLDNARAYANQTHLALANHADAIKMLAKDRKTLRLQRAKRDATIERLRARIASLEATVKAQEDQLNEMEEDGEDIQGGEAFLSDDDDFEEDENTEEEDYEFLEAGEDGIIPIDVDDDEE